MSVLEYERHAAHQLRLVHLSDIHPADAHAALTHVPETGNEPCHRCLSTAGSSHKRHCPVFGNGEIDVAEGILFCAFISERDIFKAYVAGLWLPDIVTFGQRGGIGQFLQSIDSLVCQEKILTEIHHLHHIGCDDRCNDNKEKEVGNDHRHTSPVPDQDDAHRHEEEGKGIDGNCICRHRRTPQQRVQNDKVTIADDAVVEPLEREDGLLENLHHRDAAYILHSLAAHLLLRIEILLLEVVVSRVHHIAHDAEGTDDWQHSRQAQLPVHCQ